MEKSSSVIVTFGKRLNRDTCTLLNAMSPSTYSEASRFTAFVSTGDDSMTCAMTISEIHMPTVHSSIFIRICLFFFSISRIMFQSCEDSKKIG